MNTEELIEFINNLAPSYIGVLDSNEKRRGYELAWEELKNEILKNIKK